MGDVSFLYGIGAAKAGTTWLAQVLRAHPQCALPPVKETHYFDALEHGSSMWAMDQILRIRKDARLALREAGSETARARARKRVSEIDLWLGLVGSQAQNDPLYERLMLRNAASKTRVVADVTPAYALLDSATFARMAGLNGGKTRFLMVLRDPVDRLWSNLTMILDRRVAAGGDPERVRASLLDGVARGSEADALRRSDYAGTLAQLSDAVPAHKCLTVYFEELVAGEASTALTEFLGLNTPLEAVKDKANAGSGHLMTDEERARLAPLVRPQYDDALRRFGRVPERWQANMQEARI